jgi:putative membrane-bound dehydrogenase-like protein
MLRLITFASLLLPIPALAGQPEAKPLKILFLGDNGHHRPLDRFRQLQAALAPRGIQVVYTDEVSALQPQTLSRYDGLIVYANIDAISPEQEKALLDYVESGKGFIPLHCASYCFRNSDKYVALVGAQFLRHDTGVFRTTIAAPDHPIMKGFGGFESWDETYVHTKHNEKDRTVLEYRAEGGKKEPWTWVRTQGKGRVFYTAWGHDERTWGNVGFQNLIERGIRWACGQDPGVVPIYADRPPMRPLAKDAKPFEYVPANVPFYPPSPRWGVTGENFKQMQKPLSPEESMKHITTPVQFELKLFVDESKLGGGKPICMNWDERGRLWVALTTDYPNNRQPLGQGHDRIVICEDTDGDGVCDKVTTFADKLSIPTSLLCYDGGVIVTQPPYTLFLKDSKGNGIADVRKVLFSGWGTSDSHAGPSNLHYGFDNWIYGIVGYAGFNGTVGGEQHRFSQGFYRFKPDGSKLEFLRSTTNNSWGVGFSEEGLLFGSTANGCPSVYMPIPNRYYEAVRGWSSSVLQCIADSNKFEPITEKVRQVDYHGGFTAGAGHALYTARRYPKEYWNRTAFVCEPTGHLVATFTLRRQGTDYHSKNAWNLVASNDEWCAPIAAEVGPDGNVWVIDWYNFIVQHNPTPPGFRTGKGAAYETDLRDKTHGRIYRVVATSGSSGKPISLANATPEQLVEQLTNDNLFWRLAAQRMLVQRGKTDVSGVLTTLIADQSADETGLNAGAVHALWTMKGLGLIEQLIEIRQPIFEKALSHQSAAVRRAALMVLPHDAHAAEIVPWDRVLHDSDPTVRSAAFLAAADLPVNAAVTSRLAATLRDQSLLRDRWLADALIAAAAAHAEPFLGDVAGMKAELPPGALPALSIVAEHYARGGNYSAMLIGRLKVSHPKTADIILAALAKGWPRDSKPALTAETEADLGELFKTLSPAGKGHLLKLATTWGSKRFADQAAEITRSMLSSITDEKQTEEVRTAAVRQLGEIAPPDAETAAKLLGLVNPQSSPAFNEAVFETLSNSAAGVPILLKRVTSLTPATRAAALRSLLARVESTRLLLDAMDKGVVQSSDLALDQRQALAAHTNRAIARRAQAILARGGGLPNPDREKVVQEYLSLTKKTGDAALGKIVFKNNCAKCHIHGTEGAQIGPNLSGVAVHSKEHLLVDILDPSRNVEGNFRVYRVEMKDGQSVSGLLASETKTTIELIDTEAKKHILQRADIEELQASNKSLMPEGFEKQLKADDLANLLEFLTQRGKYLPIPLDKAATVVTTRGMFFSEDATVERLIFRDWSPKVFDGVPFQLIDPQGGRTHNAIMLYGPQGKIPPTMPKAVTLTCNSSAKAIHFLSGVGGWCWPATEKGTTSLIVRLHYADGKLEDHNLLNGEQFADYIRRVDVPGSRFAFSLRGQQIRYFSIEPKRPDTIKEIELVKGSDTTAPVVMAVTIEGR